MGVAVMQLGGGRRRADDKIDYAVGLTDIAGIGESVGSDNLLCRVHARSPAAAEEAAAAIRHAMIVADAPAQETPLIYQRVAA